MPVDLSDRARAAYALQKELESVEQQQLKLGEKMSEVLYEQVVLAEKSRLLKQAMEQFLINQGV